jgi:hypothetical protein
MGTLIMKEAFLAIDGGPVSLTLSPVSVEDVTTALAAGSAGALYALDPEYAPFWCPRCGSSYCRDHWEKVEVFDEGFFDYSLGTCPKHHRRKLVD